MRTTYPLDCTALMLPYAFSKTRPPVFRLTVVLTEKIDPCILKQAVQDLVARFPTLYTRLRRGFVWDCLEHLPAPNIVAPDNEPCRSFAYKDTLLRVLYRENQLSIECCHLTADGMAAVVYLNSLTARYLELRGHVIEKSPSVLHCEDNPTQEELTDGYRAVYEKPQKKQVPLEGGRAYTYNTRQKEKHRQITCVQLPIDALKAMLNEKYDGCTITEYLTAVFACALLAQRENTPKQKRPIRLAMPSNLRQFWQLGTLRNFAAATQLTFLPQQTNCDFLEILAHVRVETRNNLTREKTQDFINQTVSYLNMLNFMPGFVKRIIVSAGALLLGRVVWPFTSSISNLGYIQLPPSLAKHIESYTLVMGGFDLAKILCGAAGVNNVMTVAFSTVNETAVRDFCIDFYQNDGLPVQVTTRDF